MPIPFFSFLLPSSLDLLTVSSATFSPPVKPILVVFATASLPSSST
jgi:hypothetical protein